MADLLLNNVRVITPVRDIPRGFVELAGGKVRGVGTEPVPRARYGEHAEVWDLEGRIVAPGFIDLHVHGGGGREVMEGRPEAVLAMARTHATGGTTSMLPTTTAAAWDAIEAALASIREAAARAPGAPGALVLGAHLEGPYLSQAQLGAQDGRHARTPDPREYRDVLARYPEVRRMSAAPELPGGLELGRFLREKGILAAVAHSNATDAEMLEAVEAGYSLITHFYSSTSMVRREKAYRIPGIVEFGYLWDGLDIELIADGHHLPATLLKLAYKTKGPAHVALITDAMGAAGLPEGEWALGTGERSDGRRVIVEGGVAKLPDRSSFAGSVTFMICCVRNMVRLAGVPLAEAVHMATRTPARIAGVAAQKGTLAAGYDADLVVLSGDLEVERVVVGGREIYRAPSSQPKG